MGKHIFCFSINFNIKKINMRAFLKDSSLNHITNRSVKTLKRNESVEN